MQAEPPAEARVGRRQRSPRVGGADAPIVALGDPSLGARELGVGARWIVDREETVEATALRGPGDPVVPDRRAVVSGLALGSLRRAPERDAPAEPRTALAGELEPARRFRDFDRDDALTGRRRRGRQRRGQRRLRFCSFGRRLAPRAAGGNGRAREREQRGEDRKATASAPLRASALAGLCAALLAVAARAADFERLPEPIGERGLEFVQPGETLLDIAYQHRVGFELLERLNPGVDRWIPDPGTIVQLPTWSLPPQVDAKGIAINLPEMRLYRYGAEGGPEVFHVAIGDGIDPTLIGSYRVGEKRPDPFWRVPESIRLEKPELPAVVPPGPDNPLGDRWMTIGTTSYGIHGTNNPWSIGRLATHGCVRLYADEMRRLYDATPKGTRIQIVYQPFKWGRDGDDILLEVHPDPYRRIVDPLTEALAIPAMQGLADALDLERVRSVLVRARGAPERVGRRPAADAGAISEPTS